MKQIKLQVMVQMVVQDVVVDKVGLLVTTDLLTRILKLLVCITTERKRKITS